jgi:hypothetical protein
MSRCVARDCVAATAIGRALCPEHLAGRKPKSEPEMETTGVHRIVRLGFMDEGPGERDDSCAGYAECLGEAARSRSKSVTWHCPDACPERRPVDRAAERDHAAMSRSGWPGAALGGGGWRAPGTGGGEG